MSQAPINSREQSQIEISEIVLAESEFEPLTSGPCRLVVPISSKRLGEAATGGRLTFLEVYVAKMFEVTIYKSTIAGRCEAGIGSSLNLIWSLFSGDSEGSKDGQRLIGNYNILRKLACEKAKEFGLSTSETTLINDFGVGTTKVDIPVLDIFDDDKISKWKQFVESFVSISVLGISKVSVKGHSKRGDFQEALADAIFNAKELLKTDFVTWTLSEISGFNGGLVGVNTLGLTISITSTSPSSEAQR
jgi:hypothetical protein